MKNRFFMIILVVFLLLLQALLGSTENAFMQDPSGNFLFSYDKLDCSLPFAIFTAAACVATLGMGAGMLSAAAHIAGQGGRRSGTCFHLATCGMWCGWPVMAACLASLYAAFPAMAASSESLVQSPQFILLAIGLPGMLACQVLNGLRRRPLSIVSLLLVLGIAAACSYFWLGNFTDVVICAPLAGCGAVMLLRGSGPIRTAGTLMLCCAVGYMLYAMLQAPMFKPMLERRQTMTDCIVLFIPALVILAGLAGLRWYTMAPQRHTRHN